MNKNIFINKDAKIKIDKIVNECIDNVLNEIGHEKGKLLVSLNEDYRKMLKEEWGIDYETELAADEILEKIRGIYKQSSNVYKNAVGIKSYKGGFQYAFKGVVLQINYNVTNFIIEDNYKKYSNLYTFNSGYNNKTKTIEVNIGMVNGGFIVGTSINSIQHELSHALDDIGNKGHYIPDKLQYMYDIATTYLENPPSNLVYELCAAVYASFKTEQIAHANALDSLYRKYGDEPLNVTDTNEYSFLFYLKKVIDNIGDYKTPIEKLFKISTMKMSKLLTKAYYYYLRRIGRVAMKHKKLKD